MPDDHISQKRAVYRIAGMERAIVRKDVVYRTTDAGPLTHGRLLAGGCRGRRRLPAVVLVAGYNDAGYEKMLGCQVQGDGDVGLLGTADRGVRAGRDRVHEPGAGRGSRRAAAARARARGIARHRRRPHRRAGPAPATCRSRLSALMQPRTRRFLRAARCSTATCSTSTARPASRRRRRRSASPIPNAGRPSTTCRRMLPLFIVRAGQEQFPRLERLDRPLRRKGAGAQPADHARQPSPPGRTPSICWRTARPRARSSGRCWTSCRLS